MSDDEKDIFFESDFDLEGEEGEEEFYTEQDFGEGPFGEAAKNHHYFLKMLSMRSAIEGLLEWRMVLEDVIKDRDVSPEEIDKSKIEMENIDKIWCAFADELYRDHGVSA